MLPKAVVEDKKDCASAGTTYYWWLTYNKSNLGCVLEKRTCHSADAVAVRLQAAGYGDIVRTKVSLSKTVDYPLLLVNMVKVAC